jgi:hypothetical protein
MSKRFTDKEKWRKPWFRKLNGQAKMVWIYLTDNCDHAGFWPAAFDLMELDLGFKVSADDMVCWFGDKVELFDDKYLIRSFIDFQYGTLNPENRVHRSVLSLLEKAAAKKGLIRPFEGCKDKYKNKDKDKNKDKEAFDFEKIFAEYPKRPGTRKLDGITSLSRQVKTNEDFELCLGAARSYRLHCEKSQKDPSFIMQFKTWCGSVEKPTWREWIKTADESEAEFMKRNGIVER